MIEPVCIRPASVIDAAEIASIHCSIWRDAYANVLDPAFLAGPIDKNRRALWLARLTIPSKEQTVLVAEMPSTGLAAFICLYCKHDAQWGHLIDNLHVLPHLRGRRVGEQLMRAAALSVRSEVETIGLHLWAFEANEPSLRFYQRLGGQVVERGVSEISAANGAPVLRVFWPDSLTLLR